MFKEPLTHVFRSMRTDMDDLVHTPHAAESVDPKSDYMRCAVLAAVGYGSIEWSPFLHTAGGSASFCHTGTGLSL